MSSRLWNKVRAVARALPGLEEGVGYGTPAFRLGKKFYCRLRDDTILALRLSIDERELLMEQDPSVYFITDHYRGYPAILINLDRIRDDALRNVMEHAWLFIAPRKLIEAYRAGAFSALQQEPARRTRPTPENRAKPAKSRRK
jgi:hypothetical protein